MPYISASIILMLLGEVLPALRKASSQEGAAGHKKIQEYTRYLTVPLCLVQGMMYMKMFAGQQYILCRNAMSRRPLMGMAAMTAGTLFLMWLGEQIDEYGIGNGISLIIMAGILSRMPWAIKKVLDNTSLNLRSAPIRVFMVRARLIFLLLAFVFRGGRGDFDHARVSDGFRSSRPSRCAATGCMAVSVITCRCV